VRQRNSVPSEHAAATGFSDIPISNDAEDVLQFGQFADALAELIDSPQTYTPLTLAISAPWGSGKTSLARLVEQRLMEWPLQRGDQPHVVCWFLAWLHDDAPHLGAALAADVAKSVGRYRPLHRRLVTPLPSAMLSAQERWRRRLTIAAVALVAALPSAFVPGLRHLFVKQGVGEGAAFGASLTSLVVVGITVYLIWARLFAIAQAASSFIDDPQSEAARGSMAEVKNQLGAIVKQATKGGRRIVIFVDDLERCRPPKAVDVCEVATQLLAHPQVVTVLLADMRAVAAAAAIKYAELEGRYAPATSQDRNGDDGRASYGRAYLEKVVQLEFRIPAGRDLVKRLVESELPA
jgi:KAP family P-loop domain